MKKNSELFTTMPVGKAIAKLAIPTVVSQIIVILYSLADTFFIGQIGDPNQIAALSITFPIYTLLTAVANLFGIGANSVISRCLGKNDENTAKKASSFSFWGSIIITLFLSIALAIFMKPILVFFGADSYTLGYTSDYLFWVFVIGGIPTVAGLVLGHLVRAIGKTKEAGIGLTLGGILNIILDPIFIFVFKMNVAGAAVATMLSNTISLFYFLFILFRIHNKTVINISPKKFTLDKKVSLTTLSVGFPAALSVLLVSVSIALLNGLLLKHEGGNILSAAYGVTSKCGTIALHISIGIAQGVMPLIGYSYGAKDHKRVHEVCKLSFIILLIFSIIFLLVVQFFPMQIVSIFINDSVSDTMEEAQKTIEVGTTFMRCWSWCVVGMSLFNMYNSIFQAVGKWKVSLLLAVVRLGVIFTILCFVLDALFGVYGLMWVQAITDTLSCLLAAILYEIFKRNIMRQAKLEAKNVINAPTNSNFIITISREFGSGGRTIGKEVANKLGINCYDSELIERIANESGLAKEYIENHDEYTKPDSVLGSIMATRDYDGYSITDTMWRAQKKVIIDLANKESCVIVGRCADFILKDINNCLTVFIYAPIEKRAKRIVENYGERSVNIIDRINEKDKKRKNYYELYTGNKWGQIENYDLGLNSEKIGIDGCSDIIVNLYKSIKK